MEKVISTGISPEYVKGWDVEKAIREIVQNWIDSKAEFKCSGTIEWERQRGKDEWLGLAKIKDNGPGLEMRHLAMGISEKSEEAIGKYGEGLKLALLVMAREKRDIMVWSKGQIIRPVIEFDEDYQTDTLKLKISSMLPRHAAKFTGTSIKFTCTKEELEKGKSYFMAFKAACKDSVEWVERGKISLPGGRVYVNGAAVGSIPDAIYSYHINGEAGVSIGNRDRTAISEGDLNPLVRRMIATTRSLKAMKAILLAVAEGRGEWETRLGLNECAVPQRSMRLWKKAINMVFGSKILLGGNQEANNQAAYRGYQVWNAGSQWTDILRALGMRSVYSLNKMSKASVKTIKVSTLSDEERGNLRKAMKLTSKHYAKTGKVEVAEDLNAFAGVVVGSDVDGLWVPKRGKIYVKRAVLKNLKATVHVVLHETVHKVSGHDDCTAEFERALLDVAVGMMKL